MIEISGIELLPPWPIFLSFALAGLALNIVPGADMTFVMANAAKHGRKAGILASLGIGAGALAHVTAAVLGLSALLAASQTAFNVLKLIGVAYLLYIALSMIRSGAAQSSDDAPVPQVRGSLVFRSAVLVNILNPKVAIFFLAFLPQFVDPNAAWPALQILCLGLWFDFVGTVVNIIVAIASADAAARLKRFGWVSRAAKWLAGATMAALAVKLAFSAPEKVPG
jgi:threonine/homoserine/homoserine lactone efflux protein